MAAFATLMASTSSISEAEAVVVTVEAAELGLASGEEVELVPSGLKKKFHEIIFSQTKLGRVGNTVNIIT